MTTTRTFFFRPDPHTAQTCSRGLPYNPVLKYLPAFANSLPVQVLLAGIIFTLTCVDCSLHTNVSLGLHFDISINTLTNGTSCLVNANQSCFSLNEAVMNLTVHDLNLTAALEVGMGKEVEVVANYT